jgi:hypothetical protein
VTSCTVDGVGARLQVPRQRHAQRGRCIGMVPVRACVGSARINIILYPSARRFIERHQEGGGARRCRGRAVALEGCPEQRLFEAAQPHRSDRGASRARRVTPARAQGLNSIRHTLDSLGAAWRAHRRRTGQCRHPKQRQCQRGAEIGWSSTLTANRR